MRSWPDWIDVSRETQERLEVFVALLKKWNTHINLVSSGDIQKIWERHILDSVQIVPLLRGQKHFIDMGSGGGFPGVVIGLVTGIPGTLIEAHQKKVAFLREAIRVTEANLTVIGERLERVKIDPAPVVTARALAPLKKLLDWACPFLTPHGMGLFLKGQQVAEEIKEAQHHWQMRVDIYPSLLSSEGTLLKVSHLNRVVS
ncbi:MAG: 16S rRNA (guanine(527)-N(7))-methyltransferase RsmG [Acetobacter sp.]|nr:16S rRNA (guanine(527)-N(7))-methyltransferase RsmG [Acetobacter sp.]MBQ5497319.1 16S rRNA (guanine(527)-N(7))-methyltransferase RsmG [Acetobacter sp.]